MLMDFLGDVGLEEGPLLDELEEIVGLDPSDGL
jgi:hypothetical protein